MSVKNNTSLRLKAVASAKINSYLFDSGISLDESNVIVKLAHDRKPESYLYNRIYFVDFLNALNDNDVRKLICSTDIMGTNDLIMLTCFVVNDYINRLCKGDIDRDEIITYFSEKIDAYIKCIRALKKSTFLSCVHQDAIFDIDRSPDDDYEINVIVRALKKAMRSELFGDNTKYREGNIRKNCNFVIMKWLVQYGDEKNILKQLIKELFYE